MNQMYFMYIKKNKNAIVRYSKNKERAIFGMSYTTSKITLEYNRCNSSFSLVLLKN